MISRFLLWTDDRLGIATFVHHALRKAFPDHWSFMLGEINMYAFIVLVATGTFLALFFVPGHTNVVYEGPYAFLRGTRMSEAYDSALRICFQVNAGLLIRQIHHWAANIFVAGIVVHMGRIFFSGAFRNPRELNWIVGVLLLFAGMFEGFTGYSMPDDLLSGVGLRIAVSILQSVPFIGTWATFFLIGGVWPTGILIQRLFVTHVFIVPALIALGITVHLAIVWRQKHTQFPGPRHTEQNVVGSPLFPQYTVRSIALFMGVIAVCCLLGSLVQINPIWLWGPYQTWRVVSPAQPDWYIGWLEGALRIGPRLAIHFPGHMIPSPFWPGIVLPFVIMAALIVYPFVEGRLRNDPMPHQLLDLPREVPVRTGLGVAFFIFMFGLFAAGSDDVQARYLHLPIDGMVLGYRIFCIAAPLLAFWITFSFAKNLQARGGTHKAERVRLTRTPEGGFEEETIV